MIKLSFLYGRETLHFVVLKKEVYYTDRLYKGRFIKCIPKDQNFIREIMMSRNRLSKSLIQVFTLSKKDQAEYDSCNTDEDVSEKIISDCLNKGCKLINKEVDNNGQS